MVFQNKIFLKELIFYNRKKEKKYIHFETRKNRRQNEQKPREKPQPAEAQKKPQAMLKNRGILRFSRESGNTDVHIRSHANSVKQSREEN